MKKKIAIVCGGYSGESVISKLSGSVVFNHLKKTDYEPYLVIIEPNLWQVEIDGINHSIDKNDFSFTINKNKTIFDGVFIAIHGSPGENGLFQGYLDMLKIPYNSGSVFGSSLTFNKKFCNDLLKQYGIKSAVSISLVKGENIDVVTIVNKLGLPCFVKPNKGGSSIGISKVKRTSELLPAIEKAFIEDDEIVIEQFISGTEVTCGVINYKGKVKSIGITEIVSKNEFFDYQAKYHDLQTEEITPARISKEIYESVEKTTIKIYKTLRFKGIIRTDYIIQNDEIFLIEVNTVPGLSEASIVPKQAQFSNISLSELFKNECDSMFTN